MDFQEKTKFVAEDTLGLMLASIVLIPMMALANLWLIPIVWLVKWRKK